MTQNTQPFGGPAFPVADTVHPIGQVQFGTSGMTLLDYFAAKAMEWHLGTLTGCGKDAIAFYSYEMAAAMIKEREKYLNPL